MAEQEKDTLIRNVAIAAGAITALAVAVLVIPYAMRDKWEIYERARILKTLEEADQLKSTNPLLAYKTYDEILKESKEHKITDENLLKKFAFAEKSRIALYKIVQENIKEEEAEKRRRAAEEAKRIADEKKRIAKEQEQKHAAEEAQKIAEEKLRAEEKRRKEAVSIYKNIPQSAPQSVHNALNALKKVEARIEVGVSYVDYSRVVGETWGEVKIFVESPDGKRLPEFSMLLTRAVSDYKSALNVWHSKIEYPTLAKAHEVELEKLQQLCWLRAGIRLRLAESLLESEKVEKTLEMIATDKGEEEDIDAKLNKILLGK